MEAAVAVLSAVTGSVVTKLLTVIEKRWKELEDLEDDIDFLHKELPLIFGSLEAQILHKGQPSVEIISMEQFRALAHNIEDCLDRFLPCTACEGEKIHRPKRFRRMIARLKRQLDEAHQRRERYSISSKASASAESNVDSSPTDLEDMGTDEACPAVGIEEARQELWNCLVDGQASKKLRVISIVGFGGSGKTTLASAVYKCPEVVELFTRRAMTAVSSKHGDATAKEVLLAILKGLLGEQAHTVPQKLRQVQQNIRDLLQTERCLIVIDDIKMELWDAIKHIFPEETESRILVTTAVSSVANACSMRGGYVHNMQSLSAKQSKHYLDKNVFIDECSPELERGSTAIVNKCDGHPLALVSVANSLQGHKLTGHLCEEISKNICSRMDENKNGHFTKLVQVLMNHYCSLPDNALKTCLLYTTVFPNGRPVDRKTVTMRWLAEGYINGDLEVANKNLDELIDRNIFRPTDPINNGKVKTCKPHGIMHQLMLHKSRSSNFIATSFGATNHNNFRHLIIENHTNRTSSSIGHGTGPVERGQNSMNSYVNSLKKCYNSITKSVREQLRPRSLTVFGNLGEADSDLTSFKLLRVLDLEECDDLNEEQLGHIYKLLHLKYLTLGNSISNLPVQMERLHRLETLDLRKTKIETLPVEVICLPHLTHLLGKIKVKKERVSGKNRKRFLQGKSNLQTLAGAVVDNSSALPELMVHMKKLTKVKIWCETTSTDSNYTTLLEAIHKFAQAGVDTPVGARSLTLHLNDSSKDLLHHCKGDNTNASRKQGYITSVKLQGSLSHFPQFVMSSLCGLKELCLTSTNLTGSNLLPDLLKLPYLVYLKLVEVHLEDVKINLGDFPSLLCLCLVVQEPKFPTIQEGALPRLTSIQLLCKDLVGLCDHIKVESFKALLEVALDSMVNQDTKELWKNVARNHPKRPKVLLLKRIDPANTRSAVKYIVTDQISSNPMVQSAP